jgi:hypothetical protein
MEYKWKITFDQNGESRVTYHFTINSMAGALASLARNAKSTSFKVEKVDEQTGTAGSGTEAGAEGEQSTPKTKRSAKGSNTKG